LPPLVPVAIVAEPKIEQRVIELFCASALKRIVPVPAVDDTVVFENVSEFLRSLIRRL
jgi:hypothetical protein